MVSTVYLFKLHTKFNKVGCERMYIRKTKLSAHLKKKSILRIYYIKKCVEDYIGTFFTG